MTSDRVVHCLLEGEGWTPEAEGYKSLAKATVGDYDLGLWKGVQHVDGKPTSFYEISLNRRGLNFDPDSQKVRYPGGAYALGSRHDLLRVVAGWIQEYGSLFVGSGVPRKAEFYHRLFKRYLSRLRVSDLYAPFDECEGKPEYFAVSATGKETMESLLESLEPQDDFDPGSYIDELPSWEEQIQEMGRREIDELRSKGQLNADNYCEYAESIARNIVDKYQQPFQVEWEASNGLANRTERKLCNYLILYAGNAINAA